MAGDRELDVFLAERLFGLEVFWRHYRTEDGKLATGGPYIHPGGKSVLYQISRYTEQDWPLVADAMAERKYMLTMQRDIGAPMMRGKGGQWVRSDEHWKAQYEKGSLDDRLQGRGIWRVTADTPGLAVCRAARAALEAAKEG